MQVAVMELTADIYQDSTQSSRTEVARAGTDTNRDISKLTGMNMDVDIVVNRIPGQQSGGLALDHSAFAASPREFNAQF